MMEDMNGRENEAVTKGDMRRVLDEFRVEFRAEMKDMFRPIVLTLAKHTAELAGIRSYMTENLVTRDEFHTRMDGFTSRVDDYDYSAAKNRDRLDAHERRIAALEKKRS
jgi:hypothetical protein